jgi:hypothetical protein
MSAPSLLLRVATTWSLPGLGLLALPDGPTPLLLAYSLHTALTVQAVLPDGTCHLAGATVEEITRPGDSDIPARGLLLDFGSSVAVLPGTEIHLRDDHTAETI